MADRLGAEQNLNNSQTCSPPGAAGFDFHANKDNKTAWSILTRKFDVLVIGGGNAALCAAISARRAGASVLVLEGAPKFYRGGNTRHTRNMRCAHDAATGILTGPYTEQEFWEDLSASPTARPTRISHA